MLKNLFSKTTEIDAFLILDFAQNNLKMLLVSSKYNSQFEHFILANEVVKHELTLEQILEGEFETIRQEITKRLSELVRKCGLPIDMPDLDPQTIIDSLYHDKKTMNNKIKFILVKEIGVIEIVDDLPKEDILKMLHTQV